MTITHVSKEELTTPKDGHETVVNHWWWESADGILDHVGPDGHRKMQANRNKNVMEYMTGKSIYAGHTPVLLPVAYYPIER